MSQSAAWDALVFARFDCVDRPDIAAIVMAEADFAYVRCSACIPCPPLILDEDADYYEDRDPVGMQVRHHRARIHWEMPASWVEPAPPIKASAEQSDDVFEARLRSYVNIITHRPGAFVVLGDV